MLVTEGNGALLSNRNTEEARPGQALLIRVCPCHSSQMDKGTTP